MLVLSRKLDESFIIGDEYIVTVVGIRSDKVRLGVVAPRDVSVHRREVYEDIRREAIARGDERVMKTPDPFARVTNGRRRDDGDGQAGQPARI